MPTLLVIDMQVGLFGPDSKRHDPAGTIGRINKLIDACREKGLPVVFIQHDGIRDDNVEPDTPGWEIHPDLHRAESDPVVHKAACDAFCETGLAELLDALGPRELIVTGCCSEFCVDTTVRAAASRGYLVTVASDCHTTAKRPHLDAPAIITHHNWVWANLLLPRSEVRVIPLDQILSEL